MIQSYSLLRVSYSTSKVASCRLLSTNLQRSSVEPNFLSRAAFEFEQTSFKQKLASAQKAFPNACINLAKYPWLMDLSSPAAKAAILEARESVRANGAAFFPEFITTTALRECVKECKEQDKDLREIDDLHNIYYNGDDTSYPADHIRNCKVRTRVAVIPYDRFQPQRALNQVYHAPVLKSLVQQVLQKPKLYRSADRLARCSVNVLKDGWSDEWHFDEAEFATTIMLQRPLKGGSFEVAPTFKTPTDEFAFEKVQGAITRGEGVRVFNASPGTLAMFNGNGCLHRVTAVEGADHRYVAVLTFSTKPAFVNSPKVQEFFFGRVNQDPLLIPNE